MSKQSVAENLRRRLLTDISAGALPPGARLGSEREIAEHYSVSRSTLRQVLAGLEASGLVRRVAGRTGGTFISHAKVERDLTKLTGVPAYLARQGYAAGSRILSTQMMPADRPTRSALGLDEHDLVFDVRRVRLADGTPFSLDHARFPADRFPGLLEMPLGGSMYELFEENYGTRVEEAEEEIEIVNATDEEALVLAIPPGSPLLAITRTSYNQDGVPIEFSLDLLRSDRVKIRMRTQGRGLREALADDAPHFATISPV
jgi:GntR family transcriptional regulator